MAQDDFNWYELVKSDTPLEQGDLIDDFPIPDLDHTSIDISKLTEGATVDANAFIKRYDLIVMTQSCDLPELNDDDRIIFCPRFPFQTVLQQHSKWNGKDMWNKLRKGNVINSHLLNKCEIQGYEFEYQMINLDTVFTIPFNFVKKVLSAKKDRIRLLPPYREQLAQAFARKFMRIGLPNDIPEKYPYG